MRTLIAILCDTEAKAYEIRRGLQQLQEEGALALYETLVIERDADGDLSTMQTSERTLRRTGLGAALGGLIGLVGGPAGVILGVAVGGFAGAMNETVRWTINDEYVENIGASMARNTFAVLAQVREKSTTSLDTRMASLGAKVLRETRRQFVREMWEKRARRHRRDVAAELLDRETAKAERMELYVEADLHDARDRLKRTAEEARMQLAQTKADLDGKLAELEGQLARATPDVREDLEHRVLGIQRDFNERERKLSRAIAIAEEALRR